MEQLADNLSWVGLVAVTVYAVYSIVKHRKTIAEVIRQKLRS